MNENKSHYDECKKIDHKEAWFYLYDFLGNANIFRSGKHITGCLGTGGGMNYKGL